jgi:hypothetical protein
VTVSGLTLDGAGERELRAGPTAVTTGTISGGDLTATVTVAPKPYDGRSVRRSRAAR